MADGFAGETALLARRQTGGRGRMGRRWASPEGNLHLSVLLRPGGLRWPGHWSILAGVALAEAARAHAADPGAVRLKWPNDVLLGGGKLAGILLESGTDSGPWLVIGMGVNLGAAPPDLGRATASLGPHGPAPEAFAAALLDRIAAWRARYAAAGFDPVRQAWLAAAHRIGERVATTAPTGWVTTAPAGPGRIEGVFAGLADSGAMLLDTPSSRQTIVSGEIVAEPVHDH